MPFEIVRNDITRMKVTAIVNAANNSLLGGGGVDGAIHKAAGPELLAECRTLNGCETGQAKITNGYNLPAKYVIHTVGPVWQGGNAHERELLASCYRTSLKLAAEYQCESAAFPLISAGAYGYPKEEAMDVAVETIREFLENHDMTVYLAVFSRGAFFEGKKLFRDIREYVDDHYVESVLEENSRGRRHARMLREQRDLYISDGQPILNAPSLLPEASEAARKAPGKSSGAPLAGAVRDVDWKELLKQTDEGFSQTLLRMIDERGMKDAECYKKANVDRRLFSKIRSDPGYKPSKPTACAFAMALELSLPETRKLLDRAGFTLSRSSEFDLIMEYCFRNRFYDVLQINEVLFDFDLPLLGSGGKAS